MEGLSGACFGFRYYNERFKKYEKLYSIYGLRNLLSAFERRGKNKNLQGMQFTFTVTLNYLLS